MAKERETDRGKKKMFVGVIWNCAAELKILLTALVILCSIITLLQLLPSRFTISASDLRVCISRIAQPTAATTTTTTAPLNNESHLQQQPVSTNSTTTASPPPPSNSPSPPPPSSPSPPPPPPPPSPSAASLIEHERIVNGTIIKRAFNPYGAAAYNFITMGAYRGGLNTFAVIGLSSKPLHVYGNPTYRCEWVPNNDGADGITRKPNITGVAYKILPDWGYGRVYTVVIVNCSFRPPINAENNGGNLILYASTSGGGDSKFNLTDEILVLEEKPGTVDFNLYKNSKPKYDYLYCGSSLYGNLSPQRIREWLAYHVRFFGEKSHFIIHDAGGVHEEVYKVLKPWMDLGYVTLQDIREQERFDGYYHNQFMVVNDCLHRYKFMTKWMFFFDVDEFIYVKPKTTIRSFLDSMEGFNQFTIEQMPMSSQLCHSADAPKVRRKWGMEKLLYRDWKRGLRRDRKYAVQPRALQATGVHMSMNLHGKTTHKTEGRIKYFHYHGSIATRREPCRTFVNGTFTTYEKTPYVMDNTLRNIATQVKKFEHKMIGNVLDQTPQ